LKTKLLLIVLGAAVVAIYGTLAILLLGGTGLSASRGTDFTAKEAYPIALEAGQAWQGDAQFVSATASWRDLTAEQLLEENATWGFTFFSPQTRQIRIISVTEGGAEGTKGINIPPNVHTVDVASWQVDSPQVLDLFLNNGGRDFLAQYPDATVSLRLGPQDGGERLVWMAFSIYSPDKRTMTLIVDANSGEIIDAGH
jgi:hypothetical protein